MAASSGNGNGNGNAGTSTGSVGSGASTAAGVGASVGAAGGNGNASSNSSSSTSTSAGTSQGSVGSVGSTASTAVGSGLSAGDSRGYSNSMSGYGNTGFATQTAAAAHSPSASTTTTSGTSVSGTPTQSMRSYNIQGVDENGLTMKGEAGDRNGDGKISFGEAIANNFSNLGQRANTFFGGADNNGLTRAGRAADRNGDGKVSFGERVGNMLNNVGTNINQTFGGVNYQGFNKSGEQVVAPGEHVTFSQRMTNIGHNLATRNGSTWNDENNNGVIDNGELGKAFAGRLASGIMGLVPVLGAPMSQLARGAISGKGNTVAGQLGRSMAEYAAANPSTNTNAANNTYTGSTGGPSTLSAAIAKLPESPTNKTSDIRNFMKKAKKIDISAVPVTSTYIKRGEEKAPAITVSDEDIKSFALRFYHSNNVN